MSGLGSYLHKLHSIREDILDTLTEQDVEALRELCKKIGANGFAEFLVEHQQLILEFCGATISKRKQKKFCPSYDSYLLIVLAAQYQLSRGISLLEVVEQNMIEPGCSYRDMAVKCSKAHFDLVEKDYRFWPFGGKPPFPERCHDDSEDFDTVDQSE